MKNINVWKTLLFSLLLLSLSLSACLPGATLPPAATPPPASATSPAATVPQSPTAQPTDLTMTQPSATDTQPAAQPTTPADLPDAADFPNPRQYAWKQVTFGLEEPIGMTTAGDGSGRLFFIEKPGTIRFVVGHEVTQQPFLDIRDRVGSSQSEQGLLGLTFDPAYAANGFFYVYYTDRGGDTVVSRFQVTGDANVADPGSEKVLLTQKQPYANHNGGGMAFGPDGYLYISLGDGGSAGDPEGNAQNRGTFLGKMLRIDVHQGDPYAIPAGNAFTDGTGKPEIYAWGLRNVWRFSFDSKTGDLWIADVGQNIWEEIDFIPAGTPGGVNLGWDYREGKHAFEGSPPAGLALTEPIFEYDHREGCSVTGGYVYRGSMPEWQGVYIFGDYCSGRIWGTLRRGDAFETKELFKLDNTSIPSFGVDENGEIYLLSMGGVILRLERE